jgi:PAS domain S-box-containing protein
LVINDARVFPLAYENLAIKDFGGIAYLGIPLFSPDGYSLGSLCVIDRVPREWKSIEIEMLRDLADMAMTEIALRHEIVDRRNAELEARESDVRLAIFVEHAPASIAMFDNDMRYLMVSRQWKLDYSLADRDLVGESHYAVFPEIPERWRAIHRKCLAGHIISADADQFIRVDGRKQWLSYEVRPWHHADGTIGGIVMFTRDITRQRQAREEQEQIEHKLMETQKLDSLGVLAGGIAHDFNNLLMGIIGNNSLALQSLPGASPVREYLEGIRTASQRAAELIRQMLAYSGRGKFFIQKLDLSAIVEEATPLINVSVGKKATLGLCLAPGLPRVEVDAGQIRQVIVNLVINAAEAIGDNPGRIEISTGLVRADRALLKSAVTGSDLPEGEYVGLEVNDNGLGITAENLPRIFEPFFTTKFTGRGLGLAAVLGIVRGHGGALWVTSKVGKGSTFKILLPRVTTSPAQTAAQPAPSKSSIPAGGTILLVDDEEAVRITASRMLQSFGMTVEVAADGAEAITKYAANPGRYQMVLLDLTMPHVDGAQAFGDLRRINPEVKVILMSGFAEQEATARFTGKGLSAFIQKPFDAELLKSTMRAIGV